ncbi:MAG TPA: hypothetical protein VIQ81_02795 [Gammaproteobacteria bacterium]
MNNTSNLAVLLMAGTLSLGLYGCGGGGGGDDTTTDTTTEVLVDNPQKLADNISFEGAQVISGDIPAPAGATGGTLEVASELSLTAGGTSSLGVTPPALPDGSYVHAYMIQIEGSDKTFVIPVGADGQPYGNSSTKPSASELLKEKSNTMVSFASTPRERVQLNCTGQPSIRLTPSPMQNTAPTYTAPARVQTYIQAEVPPLTAPSYDFSNIQLHTDNWSEPADVEVKVTEVGSGNFQITLTWDTATDVDLYLVEPDGHEIYYGSENSIMGDGYLDVDDLDGFGPENIYFDTNIPSGNYTVKVNMYDDYGITPTNYVVTVKRNGQSQSYDGALVIDDETHTITSFSQ